MTPRLKETYSKEIQPALKDSLGLKNIFMVPRIEKIVLNMGLGLDGADAKILKQQKKIWEKLLVKNL
jgi:large subunit ribosomal protein L5